MRELFKTISSGEWKFIYLMMIAMILITGIPYLIGYLLTPSGTVYSGVHALNPGDVFVYYSWIDQIKDGNFLLKNLLTPEAQQVGTLNVWWLGVGLMAKLFNLSAIISFQVSRLIMIPVFIIVAYLFLAYFFNDKLKRKVALVFLLFSSGVGAYFGGTIINANYASDHIAPYRWPIDLWLTESNTFLVLYQTSHFIASITLTLLIFLLFLLAFDKNKISYAIYAGIACLFYFNFHPYYLPTIFGTVGVYLFVLMLQANRFLWKKSGYLILAFLISLPSPIYHFWLIKNSSAIAQRAVQNVTNISPLPYILLGYGFLVIGFVLGVGFLVRQKKWITKHTFLICWLIVNFALIVSPFPFHSRYTQGLQLILVIFTVSGLSYLRDILKAKLKPKVYDYFVNNYVFLGLLFVILFSFSTLFNITRDLYFFSNKPSGVARILYLPQDLFVISEHLKNNGQNNIVLGPQTTSMFTAAFSGGHVYAGHDIETLYYHSEREPLVRWFYYDNNQDKEKIKFLSKNNINYVMHSLYEEELGGFDPSSKDYLQLEVDLPQAQLYRVVIPE